VKAGFLPATIAEQKGVVFAETAGAAVEGIPDGTLVDVTDRSESGMGMDDASYEVSYQGKTVKLAGARLVTEDGLQRSPDGKLAVFSIIESCGDLCHSVIYVIAADGRRAKVGDGVADLVVAWRKDGAEVAIGSGMLHLVDTATLAVRDVEKYTAPAYGPDGTLYVRDHETGSAFTIAGTDKPKRVWKNPEKLEHDEYGAEDPPPVTFDAKGAPEFELPSYGPE
jgi:hypothetical protein